MKLTITDVPHERLAGKRVLVRVDFNVPIDEGVVREDYRLRRSIPTIEYLARHGAKVIVASHLGRPGGKRVAALSLQPVAERLARILCVPVTFVGDVVGESVRRATQTLNPGEILLLENLRFDPGEEANAPLFANELASLADLYVNDAFGTMHRAHASTYGVPQQFSESLAGFLVKREIEALDRLCANPARPLIVVVGGAKIVDKLSAIRALVPNADRILLGGCIAYTFLMAQGVRTGHSPVEPEHVAWAREMLAEHGKRIALPTDHVVARELEMRTHAQQVRGEIPAGFTGFDIGRETTLAYTHELMRATGTIFWNGPMGAFEYDEFADGTIDVARALALASWRGAKTVAGGGDTVAALRKAEVLETEIGYVSTGGGAALRYISGENLPGMSVLTERR
jgi:phosphoglycerate kinase